MAIKKKSLIGNSASRLKEGESAGDKKAGTKIVEPAKPSSAKRLAVAKLVTAKLTTARMATLRRMS